MKLDYEQTKKLRKTSIVLTELKACFSFFYFKEWYLLQHSLIFTYLFSFFFWCPFFNYYFLKLFLGRVYIALNFKVWNRMYDRPNLGLVLYRDFI